MREPNGSVHSFNRYWTSIAEDPFLSFPSSITEDASLLDPIQIKPLNAYISSSYPNFLSEAPQPGYDTLNGLDSSSEAEGALSLGLGLDNESPIPNSETSIACDIDLDNHFDHSSQPAFSFSDRFIATPQNGITSASLTSSEISSMSATPSTSLSPPFNSNRSLSNTLSLDPQKHWASPVNLLLANDPQSGRLALPPAPILRCPKCSRAFESEARLV